MDSFIETEEGDIGIILSIPHGGLLDPESIPERSCQCNIDLETEPHKKCPVVLVNDGYTIDVGLEITDTIKKYTGHNPYVIINHIRRAKLDPNREITVGAQNNAQAVQAFLNYHQWIDQSKAKLGRALLIDLHGRCQSDGITQLGYCLKKKDLLDLQNCDKLLSSSIGRLIKDNSGLDLISGPFSLGAFIETEGYMATPAPQNLVPGPDVYFSGGYITQRHGGKEGIDGIQVEIPRDLRIDGGEEGRKRVGHALGKAISDFHHFHYKPHAPKAQDNLLMGIVNWSGVARSIV